MQLPWVPLGLWAITSIVTAVAGPFGTNELMTPVLRTVYWTGVCGASVGLSIVARSMLSGKTAWGRLLVWLGFAAILSVGIHTANIMLFGVWRDFGQYIYLLSIVSFVVVMVSLTARLLRPRTPHAQNTERLTKFLERLPLEKRGALIRLEAQDHYLKVVTRAGECLILMRIGDATKDLEGEYGTQVHRSHWIARDAVISHKRRAGRDFLTTVDGAEIPVSRNNRSLIAELAQPMRE